MNLRTRLIVTLVAIVIPVMVLFTGFRFAVERRLIRERIAGRASNHLQSKGLERCRRAPEQFHVTRRGFEAYAYRRDGTSMHPSAPDVPERWASDLEPGETETGWFWGREHSAMTAIRTRDESTCALVFLFWRGGFGPKPGRLLWTVISQSLVMFVVLVGTGFFAGAPIVRRIRRLTEAVEEFEPEEGMEQTFETDDEIGELARAFERADERVRETIQKLERRDAALRDFVTNTTHDLSVPLTVLQHRLKRLREGLEVEEGASRDLADQALEESHYIGSLVSNLGTAAKLDAGESHVTRHATSLAEVVERVGVRHEPIADQKSIVFNWAVPANDIVVEADSTLVEQAVSNCVQNALQYNVEGGHAGLVLESYDDHFEIKIIDDGPGLSEEMLQRITERSFRDEEARSRHPEGEGLGLSIARRVVELHGWTIEFANRQEGGLDVRIRGEQ